VAPRNQKDDETIALLGKLGRELSLRTILFHHAVAEHLGLNPSDHKCLDLIITASPDQPMTPGRLAELSGLTTGAITGVLDRLEHGRFLRREKALDDRRQWVIKILPDRMAELAPIFEPYAEAWAVLCSHYTPEQLTTFGDYLRRAVDLISEHTERVRKLGTSEPETPIAAGELSAMLGDVTRGHLDFVKGGERIEISAAPRGRLYRAHFQGSAPKIELEGGHLIVNHRGAFRKSASGRIELSDQIPWTISTRGWSEVKADLRSLQLEAIEVKGGLDRVTVDLPSPRGLVPIKISGGISHTKLLRSETIPIRVTLKGGADHLVIDQLELGGVGGALKWSSPRFDPAGDAYDIQVTGGMTHFTIGAH
jgi:DNA-binding MarR family transcriptional regulator